MKYILTILFTLSMLSCKKYLDKKPDIKLSTATTLADFQALLDHPTITGNGNTEITEIGADNYYFYDHAAYLSRGPVIQKAYTWNSEIWDGGFAGDWNELYKIIYTCNVVMEGLETIPVNNAIRSDWETLKGWALFVRGATFYALEETFGQPYRPASASSDLGIVLKLSTSINDKVKRSSVEEVFNQIVADISNAALLLPDVSAAKNRPTKTAANGMLARVYLTMQNYAKAGEYANKVLQVNNRLFDFATMPMPVVNNPFSSFAPPNDSIEVLYPLESVSYGVLRSSTTNIDSILFNSYDNNDLRKTVFFRISASTGKPYFKGNYMGNLSRVFTGPAVDEMYLIRAECYARAGNKDAALNDLNTLLIKRWKNNGSFIHVTAADANEALVKIIMERRKELVFRNLRWSDLRRLNQDPQFAVTLKRVLNGQTISLGPNDPKYTYPIPESEIRLSNIPQNPR